MNDVSRRQLEILEMLASPEFEQISITFAKAFAVFTAEMLHYLEGRETEEGLDTAH